MSKEIGVLVDVINKKTEVVETEGLPLCLPPTSVLILDRGS